MIADTSSDPFLFLDQLIDSTPEEQPANIEQFPMMVLTTIEGRPDNIAPAMSSLQIADITGKPHNDILKDIRRILEEAEIGVGEFSRTYTDASNRQSPCYFLPRRECDLVISGYSVKYRLAIIDRWQELEAKVAQPDPFAILNDPAAMRGLLLGYTEQVIALESQVAVLAPKAAGLDRIAGTEGTMNITAAAKTLGLSPKRLFQIMDEQGWIYKRGTEWLPMQTKINSGHLDCKIITFTGSDNTERTTTQARVTSKGLARLSAILAP